MTTKYLLSGLFFLACLNILAQKEVSEVGVIFGEQEAENVQKSRYYTMKGLGSKGLRIVNSN